MIGYNIAKVHSYAWLNIPIFYYPILKRPTLIAVSGRNQELTKSFAERFGYKRTYSDWRALIRDPEVEVVDICTPPNVHSEPAIACCEAGKPMLCEKPLARDAEEAKEMLRAAEKAGVVNMTGFNYRFVPAVSYAKKLIDDGFVGRVLNFRGAYLNVEVGDWGYINPNFPLDWHFRAETAGHGAIGDLGSHIIDLSRYLVGEISSVAGATATFVKERPLVDKPTVKGKVEVEDAAVAAVKFANGALGTIEASWMAPGRKDFLRFEVTGNEGSIRFNLERINELEICSLKDPNDVRGFRDVWTTSKTHPMMEKFWVEQGAGFGWEHSFVNELNHFADCVMSNKPVTPVGASFYDGYRNCLIMDAIVESEKTDRWVTLEG